eukprot:TRINITY_DN53_c1_g1_i3.p1 TRINITY_DN53_c1_g1~~TRINITY_DN53_c1_g1_i3.p1  ORF type:complete len:752 (+),score=128.25 TRINITY_DN53_c1_g1_i3:56-2311(+)
MFSRLAAVTLLAASAAASNGHATLPPTPESTSPPAPIPPAPTMYCPYDICNHEGYTAKRREDMYTRIKCPPSGCDLETCCVAECGHPDVTVCNMPGYSIPPQLSSQPCDSLSVDSCTVERCCIAPSCEYFDCPSLWLSPTENPSCAPNCAMHQCCDRSRLTEIREQLPQSASFQENENGAWWIPTSGKDVLIVIGGDDLVLVNQLVLQGYAVWVRKSPCYDSRCCRESLGYSTYLADTSLPPKPKMALTGFINGDTASWHQNGFISDLVEDATNCVSNTGRFASLSWSYQASIPHWIESNNFVGNWQNSRMEAVHPAPPVWNTFLGGQFMVTSELIESRSQYFYDQLLESVVAKEDSTNSKKCELDAYDLEFAWSWIFGEEANVDPMSKSLYPDGTCTNSPKRVPTQSESQLDWLSSFERSFHFDSDGIWSYPCDDISDTACANKVMLVIGSDPTIPSSQELLHDLLVVNKNRTASYGIWLRQPTLRCHYEEMGQTVNPSCKFTEGYSRFLHHYGVDDINGAENRFLNTDTFVFLSGSKPVTVTEIEEAVEGSRIRNGYFPLGEGVTDYCPSVQVGWPQPSGLRLPVRGFETDDFAVAAHNVYTIPKNVAGYVREHSTSLVVFKPEYFRAYWHYIFGSPAILTKETVDSQDQLFPLLTCDDTTGDVLLLGDESRGDVVGSYNGVLAIKVEDNNGGGVYGLSESTISSLGLVIVVVLVAVWMCRKKDDSSEPEPETKAKPEPEGPDASNSVV